MIKAVLLDFDGTMVTKDVLDVLCDVVGKKRESERINEAFHKGEKPGLSGLAERVNLLQGLSIKQIEDILSPDSFLMPGTKEFCTFLKENDVVSILASGNIIPVLELYKKKLDLDYVIGIQPQVKDGILQGIRLEDMPKGEFKLEETQRILHTLGIKAEETIAIGDSPGDISKFLFAGTAIAINPKHGVEAYADYTITNLFEAIPLVQSLETSGQIR